MARRSIYLPDFGHKNPIPAACRIGPFVASGIIHGLDPEAGPGGTPLAEQCRLMFERLRRVLEEAGARPEHILKLNIQMADRSQREAVNREWLAMFPDGQDMPARQTLDAPLDGGKLVQCDFLAVVGESS